MKTLFVLCLLNLSTANAEIIKFNWEDPKTQAKLNDIQGKSNYKAKEARRALVRKGTQAAFPLFKKLLTSDDPVVVARALMGIRELKAPGAYKIMVNHLRHDHFRPRHAAIIGVRKLNPKAAAAELEQLLNEAQARQDWKKGTLLLLIEEIGNLKHSESVELLGNLIETSEDPAIVAAAVWSLGKMGYPAGASYILAAADSEDQDVRRASAYAIGIMKIQEGISALNSMIYDNDIKTKRYAIEALGSIGDESAAQILMEMMYDNSPGIQERVIKALGNLRATEALPMLTEIMLNKSNKSYTRQQAARALGRIGDKSATNDLISVLGRGALSKMAVQSLRKLYPEKSGWRNASQWKKWANSR